jgi:ATP-dependent helicase/nuclease subunit B
VNVLIRELSNACRDRLLDEKWIVAPSLRAGHQWLLTVARAGQPVINGHVKTVVKVALDLAGPLMAKKGLELISPQQGSLLVDRVMRGLRKPGEGYLWRLTPSVRLAETVFKAIQALRLAGLDSQDLSLESFEVDIKGQELQEILKQYVIELARQNRIDRAGVMRLALERLQSDARALPEDVLVLVPEDVDVAGLEKQLLEVLPAQKRIRLAVDQPATSAAEGGESLTDARLLRWILSPVHAPAPVGDDSAKIFRAVGEVNEVRGVLRRCLAAQIPLDEVEVLCTDVGTYVPLFYETFARLLGDDQSIDDIPVTFQEGIPARKFRPGRALVGWLAWMRDDFPQSGLVQMIQEGLLEIPGRDPEQISFSRLAAVLRSLPIGFGRDRYIAALEEHLAGLRQRAADPEPLRDEDGQPEPRRPDHLEVRQHVVELLRTLVQSLLDFAPGPDDGTARVLELAERFVESHARRVSKLDTYASQILIRKINELRTSLAPEDEGAGINARAWLAALPDEAAVGGQGPIGGRLHVAHVSAGGHSGRPHTFIVGLDDARFPGAGLQDPILLDDERKGLSSELPTAGRELAKRFDRVARLLARLRGTVTLSYSCHDLADDRETFPGSIILSAFRILSGQREADQAALNRGLPTAESFAPNQPEDALSQSEWWLWRMSGPDAVTDPESLLGACYPHLARGFELASQRSSDRFTVFDGRIEMPGPELDLTAPGGPTVSASRLETLGQCPLRYFFRYVLEIELPEELTIDPTVWLDPLVRGSLLHEVFEVFLNELIGRGELPLAQRDEPRLLAILQARIDRIRQEIPPPSESVFRAEVAQLKRTARIFLHEEEVYCRETGNRPQFLEVSIGMKNEGQGTGLDAMEPVEVKLPDGSALRVRGRIDRIDRAAGAKPNAFVIWDYKTGGSWKYTQDPPFWAGRVVQHALYLLAMNARLKAMPKEFPGATIERFGYFLPGEKASGERIEFTPEQLESGKNVLNRLARIASTGAFLATNQHDKDCGFCEYRGICGDVAAVAAASDRKLRSPANTILRPYAELRGDG